MSKAEHRLSSRDCPHGKSPVGGNSSLLTGMLYIPSGEGAGAPATLNTCPTSIPANSPASGVPASHSSSTPALDVYAALYDSGAVPVACPCGGKVEKNRLVGHSTGACSTGAGVGTLRLSAGIRACLLGGWLPPSSPFALAARWSSASVNAASRLTAGGYGPIAVFPLVAPPQIALAQSCPISKPPPPMVQAPAIVPLRRVISGLTRMGNPLPPACRPGTAGDDPPGRGPFSPARPSRCQ